MATANLGITLPTVGGSSDTWGTTLNTGITAIDALFSVSGTDVTMSDIKFNSIGLQETGAGTDTVKIQAPSAVTQYTLTMPGAVPSANEVLTASDGSGTLSWAAPTVGDITSVVAGAGMTGGGTSGAVTLNVIGTADKITVSDDAVTIASGYVGQSSITTLGTIGTGVWNGTAITGAYIDPTSSPLANTKIWIGSASNVAAEFALSGNATMTAGGVVTVSTAAACSGLAATATALATARTIGGTSFDGTANIAVALSATATALATARAINGVDFDGTAAITVTAAAGTLTGTTLKSTVVTSSLTAVGTIATGVWQGTKVASAYLDDDTAHLSGTQTFSGAKTFSAALVASSTLDVAGAATIGTAASSLTRNFTLLSDAPRILMGTGAAKPNWKVAAQDSLDSTWTVAKGGSNDSDPTNDTFTDLLMVSSTAATIVPPLTVNSAGPNSIGGAADGRIALTLGGGYTSDGSGTLAVGTALQHALTGAAGDTGSLAIAHVRGNVNTQSATESIGVVASLMVDEPIIADNLGGSGVVTVGASLYVTAAPTEGATNAALYVASGATILNGSLSKSSGSFRIDHPLPAKKDTHHLVHSFIEGPRADLIYRGVAALSGGSASVDLDEAADMSVGTWELLCRDPQVWAQNDTGWAQVRGSVAGSTLTISCEDAASTDSVSWMVVAERHDPHMIETEWTDDDGRVIVEPLKVAPNPAPEDGE